MKFEFPLQIFEKVPNIKYNQNPSSGCRAAPCEQNDMKLTVAFQNFAKAPKMKGKEKRNYEGNIWPRETGA